jgi:hypothetical protein
MAISINTDISRCNYQVIEVNSIPAWKGLESVCDIQVAKILVDDLLSDCFVSGKLGTAC